MSHFSAALQSLSSEAGFAQGDLSRATGISISSMSKYFRAAAPVGRDVASRLIGAFDSPQNSQLLAAYLRDAIPSDLAGLVAILPSGRVGEEPPDPIPSQELLKGKHRDLIAYFAKRVHDPVIYDMLAATRRALEAD